MNQETTNKEIVKSFFEAFNRGDAEVFTKLVDENVTWWVPESLPFGKTFTTFKDYLTMLRTNFAGFPTGLHLQVKSVIAEGDQVAAEVESNATHTCGFHYNNKYHFKIKLSGGKFVDVKEYNDTKHLDDLGQALSDRAAK